ncbi:hypothetical protein HDV06_004654 [Boothiomyces sp. JEL0866]|nr:hypothetical protein HDV06_004654 [Boothiomyces sp. JEL0866]
MPQNIETVLPRPSVGRGRNLSCELATAGRYDSTGTLTHQSSSGSGELIEEMTLDPTPQERDIRQQDPRFTIRQQSESSFSDSHCSYNHDISAESSELSEDEMESSSISGQSKRSGQAVTNQTLLRKQILEIQGNSALSGAEKAKMIQDLMSKPWQQKQKQELKKDTRITNFLTQKSKDFSVVLESDKSKTYYESYKDNDVYVLLDGSACRANIRIDIALAQHQMPPEYQDTYSHIYCNDCEKKSHAKFHFIYHKCGHCRGYNTKLISTQIGLPADACIAADVVLEQTHERYITSQIISSVSHPAGLLSDCQFSKLATFDTTSTAFKQLQSTTPIDLTLAPSYSPPILALYSYTSNPNFTNQTAATLDGLIRYASRQSYQQTVIVAEILKYQYAGWYNTNVEQQLIAWFESNAIESLWKSTTLIDPAAPKAQYGMGNWHSTMSEGLLNYYFLKNNTAGIQFVLQYYQRMFYSTNGEECEICRDVEHANYGIGSLVQIAESFWHQGVDLYSYGPTGYSGLPGLAQVLETTSYIILNNNWPDNQTSIDLGWGTCISFLKNTFTPGGFHIGYNHYANRLGLNMPNTQILIGLNSDTAYYFNWGLGIFTHFGTGYCDSSIGVSNSFGVNIPSNPVPIGSPPVDSFNSSSTMTTISASSFALPSLQSSPTSSKYSADSTLTFNSPSPTSFLTLAYLTTFKSLTTSSLSTTLSTTAVPTALFQTNTSLLLSALTNSNPPSGLTGQISIYY